jgi:hypothetical protein
MPDASLEPAEDLLTDGNMVRVIEGDLRNPDGVLSGA